MHSNQPPPPTLQSDSKCKNYVERLIVGMDINVYIFLSFHEKSVSIRKKSVLYAIYIVLWIQQWGLRGWQSFLLILFFVMLCLTQSLNVLQALSFGDIGAHRNCCPATSLAPAWNHIYGPTSACIACCHLYSHIKSDTASGTRNRARSIAGATASSASQPTPSATAGQVGFAFCLVKQDIPLPTVTPSQVMLGCWGKMFEALSVGPYVQQNFWTGYLKLERMLIDRLWGGERLIKVCPPAPPRTQTHKKNYHVVCWMA